MGAERVARPPRTLSRAPDARGSLFTDENSTKGGLDKRCRLEARVAGRPPVAVTAEAEKVAEALTKAADKLIHALDSDLGRAKDHHGHDTIRTQGAGE